MAFLSVIRRWHFRDRLSIREIARRAGLSRNTPDVQVQRKLYFHPASRALGLRNREAYQTRHTYATLALMAGVNPAYIARQLGPVNAAMLFKHYAKWIDRADSGREAA